VLAAAGGIALWGSIITPAGPASGHGLRGPEQAPRLDGRFRVACFNMRGGRGEDGEVDLARTAEALGGLDLIGLNEVHGAQAPFGQDQAALLGERLGMGHLFAPAERRWWRGHFGNGVLCRLPVGRWRRIPLISTRTIGLRNVLHLEVEVSGRPVQVFITHVDNRADRDRQLRAVLDRFCAAPAPAVLLGDLNAPPTTAAMVELLRRPDVSDAAASAPGDHADHIDWILVRGLRVLRAGVRPTAASDHPVVMAQFELPAAAPRAD
jgi:endonuclease/exonuclease/phosphatase family metal-dependent hydrolase